MNIQDKITELLNELERIFNESEIEINKITEEIDKYQYINNILEVLNNSKLNFIEVIDNFTDKEKEEFTKIIEETISNEELSNKIFQQIYNLIELSKTDLFNSDIIKPQKDEAYKYLDTLNEYLTNYINNYDYDTNLETLNNLQIKNERIVDLGTKFDDNVLIKPVDDITALQDLFKEININTKDRIRLLKFIIEENLDLYNNIINGYHQDRINEEKISDDDKTILNDVLQNKDILETLIPLINDKYNDDFKIDDISKEELDSIINQITKDITNIMVENNCGAEEGIQEYYKEKFNLRGKAKEVLNEYLEGMPFVELSTKMQEDIINKSIELVDKYKKEIQEINYNDKEKLDNYIESLFRDKTSRIMMYKNEYYEKNIQAIEIDAAYEINYFLNLLQYLDKEEDRIYIIKSCIRLYDILESLKEIKLLEEKETQVERNLIFLMNDNNAYIEEDLNNEIYKDKNVLKDTNILINKIKHTNQLFGGSINTNLNNINELDIQYIEDKNIEIYYIPVDEDKIIILGLSTYHNMDNYLNILEDRISINKTELIELINNIKNEQLTIEEADYIKKQEEDVLGRLNDNREDYSIGKRR